MHFLSGLWVREFYLDRYRAVGDLLCHKNTVHWNIFFFSFFLCQWRLLILTILTKRVSILFFSLESYCWFFLNFELYSHIIFSPSSIYRQNLVALMTTRFFRKEFSIKPVTQSNQTPLHISSWSLSVQVLLLCFTSFYST